MHNLESEKDKELQKLKEQHEKLIKSVEKFIESLAESHAKQMKTVDKLFYIGLLIVFILSLLVGYVVYKLLS